MFAALVAGLLILLISLTLIVLKLGFLLLLVAGPFFLIIGTHPGFGRIIAIRWFEMLVGVLMKQVAIAIVLSVLLYCYSLIMGTTDAALPWALKILMIALVTVAVFIYRKPFTHLFSAVGYGTLGSTERAEDSLREAGFTFRRNTLDGRERGHPRGGGLPGRPVGAAQPGPGRGGGGRRGRRRPGRAPPRRAPRVGRGRDRRPGRGGRRVRVAVAPRRAPRGRRGRRDELGYPPRRQRRRPGPGQEPARDRERRAHPSAAGPAAEARHRPATATASPGTGASPARPAPPPAGRAAPGARRRPAHRRPGSRARPAARPAEPSRDRRGQRASGTGGTGGPGSRQPAPAWPLVRLVRRQHRRGPPPAARRRAQARRAAATARQRRSPGARKRHG